MRDTHTEQDIELTTIYGVLFGVGKNSMMGKIASVLGGVVSADAEAQGQDTNFFPGISIGKHLSFQKEGEDGFAHFKRLVGALKNPAQALTSSYQGMDYNLLQMSAADVEEYTKKRVEQLPKHDSHDGFMMAMGMHGGMNMSATASGIPIILDLIKHGRAKEFEWVVDTYKIPLRSAPYIDSHKQYSTALLEYAAEHAQSEIVDKILERDPKLLTFVPTQTGERERQLEKWDHETHMQHLCAVALRHINSPEDAKNAANTFMKIAADMLRQGNDMMQITGMEGLRPQPDVPGHHTYIGGTISDVIDIAKNVAYRLKHPQQVPSFSPEDNKALLQATGDVIRFIGSLLEPEDRALFEEAIQKEFRAWKLEVPFDSGSWVSKSAGGRTSAVRGA